MTGQHARAEELAAAAVALLAGTPRPDLAALNACAAQLAGAAEALEHGLRGRAGRDPTRAAALCAGSRRGHGGA